MTGMYELTVTLVILLVSVNKGQCLQCYHCDYYKPDSDNSILKAILGAIGKLSDEHCKLERPEDYTTTLMKNCPEPNSPDEEMKCVYLKGRTTATVAAVFTVHIDTITRGCVSVPKNDPEFRNGCHDKLPQNPQVRSVLDQSIKAINIGDFTFDGKTCYSDQAAAGATGLTACLALLLSVVALTMMLL